MKGVMAERLEEIIVGDGSGSRVIECLLRKSPRARRLSLRVATSRKAILTLPRWSSWSEGLSFLSSQKDWLGRKTQNYPSITNLSDYFTGGGEIWLDSAPRRLEWEEANGPVTPPSVIEGRRVRVQLPSGIQLEDGLLDACIFLAKENLHGRLNSLSRRHNLRFGKMRLGNQRTRWGSCSALRTISLNWRLILLPYELGNYVLCHELAHLKHMNHSTSFWDFLEKMIPQSKKLDKELRERGKSVMGLARTQ